MLRSLTWCLPLPATPQRRLRHRIPARFCRHSRVHSQQHHRLYYNHPLWHLSWAMLRRLPPKLPLPFPHCRTLLARPSIQGRRRLLTSSARIRIQSLSRVGRWKLRGPERHKGLQWAVPQPSLRALARAQQRMSESPLFIPAQRWPLPLCRRGVRRSPPAPNPHSCSGFHSVGVTTHARTRVSRSPCFIRCRPVRLRPPLLAGAASCNGSSSLMSHVGTMLSRRCDTSSQK